MPSHPEDPDPSWNPDDEREDAKLDREFKKKFMQFMDHATKSTEREARSVIPPIGPSPGAYFITGRLTLEIRPISNGFIVRYIDMKKTPAAGKTIDLPNSVEAFIASPQDAIPHLTKAMEIMRKVFDSAPEVHASGLGADLM